MNLTDYYNTVSRRTDTKGTQINVAETKRVMSEAFVVLAAMPSAEAFAIVAKGIAKANTKAKAKAKAKK